MRTNNQDTFATAFNCMDGRCQDAVAAYARKRWDVRWVDAITEPGLDGLLAGKSALGGSLKGIFGLMLNSVIVWWIFRKAEISAKGHGSKVAVVVGHSKCAGNNVADGEHLRDIRRAVERVRTSKLFDEVIGLMASETADGDWGVSEVEEEAALAA